MAVLYQYDTAVHTGQEFERLWLPLKRKSIQKQENFTTLYLKHSHAVENSLQHYSFSNGSLTDVNNNILDVIITYIGSTLGEIPGTKSSRAQSEFSNIW
jgi:hypothetical protein